MRYPLLLFTGMYILVLLPRWSLTAQNRALSSLRSKPLQPPCHRTDLDHPKVRALLPSFFKNFILHGIKVNLFYGRSILDFRVIGMCNVLKVDIR